MIALVGFIGFALGLGLGYMAGRRGDGHGITRTPVTSSADPRSVFQRTYHPRG